MTNDPTQPPEATAVCELCGEPMPPGEQMFKFHGYSGPCPKPPLPKAAPDFQAAFKHALMSLSDVFGKPKVVGFFEDMAGDIGKTIVPIDPLGVADKKARKIAAERINSLLTQ